MARKRSAAADAETSKPKQLRKRLRKADDQLADAVSKRDRAQARVEALSIIADEIRAQLADADKAAAGKAAEDQAAQGAAAAKAATAAKKPAAARKPVASRRPTSTRKPAVSTKPAAAPQELPSEAAAEGA